MSLHLSPAADLLVITIKKGSVIMSQEDLHQVAVAAADKETAAFELDHAELNLKEAVIVALEHGTPPEVIAQAADIDPDEILDLAGGSNQPALLTPDGLHSETTADDNTTDDSTSFVRDAG